MQFGSLNNLLMDRSGNPEPEVGMGATVLAWTDRHAGTIETVERWKTGPRAGQIRALVVREDKATRTDTNGWSDAQSYTYERDPNGRTYRFLPGKDGRWRTRGNTHALTVGTRQSYHDYSF